MTLVQQAPGVVWWEGGMNVDADGAPNAYGPPELPGLDHLANAGEPGNWYGIITDAHGAPVVQGPNDPCPGMYVSATAFQNHAKAPTDPRRYVDSAQVPYVSVPSDAIKRYGLHLGDLAYVYCRATANLVAAVVADVGPKGKYGEGSIALAQQLGVPASPKDGGCGAGVVWIVFPASTQGWPAAWTDVAAQAPDLLAAAGNLERFL